MINAEFKKTSACDNVDNTENIFDSSLGLRKLNLASQLSALHSNHLRLNPNTHY